MAFSSIPDSIIQTGKAITRTLFKTYVKDNLDDLNSRVLSVENTQGKLVIFNEIVVNSASFSDLTGFAVYRVPEAYTLIDCKIYIFDKGSLTGTLEVDIKKSATSNFTGAPSVFTTEPAINVGTSPSYTVSSNAVFNGSQSGVVEGDFLRFDITSMPTNGTLGKFGIYLIAEAV